MFDRRNILTKGSLIRGLNVESERTRVGLTTTISVLAKAVPNMMCFEKKVLLLKINGLVIASE